VGWAWLSYAQARSNHASSQLGWTTW